MPAKKKTTKTVKKTVKKTNAKKTAVKTTKTAAKTATKNTNKKSSSRKNVKKNSPDYFDMIAKEAYFLFEKSGYSHGQDEKNWFEAEKRVRKVLGMK